ncbi:guanylate-binding protein 1-like [Mya arenaria]|uniref:guanylate-binding protein 1-like n=1 Tax=Mya arenaria TaxID=6604 RepID=UPI0022E47CCB|nr:guanylate-binding protein 1-like [Mya arenaria]
MHCWMLIFYRFLNVIQSNVSVARSASEHDSILDFFFPNFALVLRDFNLTSDTSYDEHLEQLLVYKTGKSDSVKEYNEPRRLIKRYFKKRKCIALPIQCTKPEKLKSMPDNEIDQEFLQRVNDLHKYLCDCSPLKLKSGKPINGRNFFQECFENQLKRFKSIVERDSLERCRRSLEKLDKKIQLKIREKKYAHVDGYSEYIADINTLTDEFTKQELYLGSKTRAALQGYMDGKVEEQLVYKMVKEKNEHQLHRLSSGSVVLPMEFADVTKGEQSSKKKALESFKKDEKDGLMSLGSEIIENLEMKLQEMEQAKTELSEDDTYYKQLVAEFDAWNNIYKQAKLTKGPTIPKPIPKPKPVMPIMQGNGEQRNTPKGKEQKPPKCPIL